MDKIHAKKVLIHKQVLDKTKADEKEWREKGLETGGHQFGFIHPNMVFEVTEFVDAGPKAVRTGGSFTADNEYATRKYIQLRESFPEIRLLGMNHLHPWHGRPYPSGIDLNQLLEASKKRPWYFIILSTKDNFKCWDLNDDGTDFIEIPYQVLPPNVDKPELLDRIKQVTLHEILCRKKVLIIGLGSLGSVVAKYLGCTGIGELGLIDNENLEVVNIIRHEGTIEQIDKPKVDICRKTIEDHNPFTVVHTYDFDVTENLKNLEELIESSDLVVSSSGSPKVNNLVNSICVKNNVPAVYGGIYAKARGAYILTTIPNQTACFNCLFNLTSSSYHIDKATAALYGFDVDELHAQQGLWTDISIPALFMCKSALALLQGQAVQHNLILYDSNIELKKLRVEKREDCAVCNFEGWIVKQEQRGSFDSPKTSPFSRIHKMIRRFLRW